MKPLHLWHHLGMGDHITNNGMVRTLAEREDEIKLFVKTHNLTNVKRMLRDLTNISYIHGTGDQDQFVMRFLDINKCIRLLEVTTTSGLYFDKIMYECANVPFSHKRSKFYFERDLNREKEVYTNILGLEEDEEYIFMHTGAEDLKLDTKLRIIKPTNMEVGLFDWGLVIERAKEVHVANSSFFCLIDLAYEIKDGTYHSYLRPGSDPAISNKWKVL